MNVVPSSPDRRGLALLAIHCSGLDPDAPSARARLEKTLGAELARELVLALSTPGRERRFAA